MRIAFVHTGDKMARLTIRVTVALLLCVVINFTLCIFITKLICMYVTELFLYIKADLTKPNYAVSGISIVLGSSFSALIVDICKEYCFSFVYSVISSIYLM